MSGGIAAGHFHFCVLIFERFSRRTQSLVLNLFHLALNLPKGLNRRHSCLMNYSQYRRAASGPPKACASANKSSSLLPPANGALDGPNEKHSPAPIATTARSSSHAGAGPAKIGNTGSGAEKAKNSALEWDILLEVLLDGRSPNSDDPLLAPASAQANHWLANDATHHPYRRG